MTFAATLRAVVLAAATLACARAESTPADATPASAVPSAAVKPAGDTTAVKADRGRILGDSTAKVWLVEISDFQCPYCKRWHDESFAMVRKDYVETGKVRIAFLNLPLSMHPNARPAAEVAMCSSAQGKFWPMHDALFASQQAWESLIDPTAAFDSLAKSVGVDVPAMRACVSSGAVKALVDQDRDRAGKAGARATPSFVLGDSMLEGAVDQATMRMALDSAVAQAARPAAK